MIHKFIKIIIYFLVKSWKLRFHFENQEIEKLVFDEERPKILCIWHQTLFGSMKIVSLFPNLVTFISRSQDGEHFLSVLRMFNKNLSDIRGSSSKGSQGSAIEAIRRLKKEKIMVIMACDGPRGPCFEAKPGALFISSSSRAPIICMGVRANKYWRLNSWDKMYIPKPFTKVNIYFGKQYSFNEKIDKKDFDSTLKSLENDLHSVNEIAQKLTEKTT